MKTSGIAGPLYRLADGGGVRDVSCLATPRQNNKMGGQTTYLMPSSSMVLAQYMELAQVFVPTTHEGTGIPALMPEEIAGSLQTALERMLAPVVDSIVRLECLKKRNI